MSDHKCNSVLMQKRVSGGGDIDWIADQWGHRYPRLEVRLQCFGYYSSRCEVVKHSRFDGSDVQIIVEDGSQLKESKYSI